MSVKKTISQEQFSSIHGRSQATAESQIARLIAEKQAKLSGITVETTEPLLRDGV